MRPALFKLEALFAEYEHLPGMLVLGGSDAASPTVQQLFEICGTRLELDRVRLSYSEGQGAATLRRAIAESYPHRVVSPDQVIITAGGSEAIFLAAHATLDPDDIALVCAPAYQALSSIAAAIGARVETYEYRATRDGFSPELDRIIARLREAPAPKLLILNTPHNPTGHVMPEQTLRTLLATARESRTTVLVDEVFAGIWHGTTAPVPSAVALNPGVAVIGSLSKVYGLSGLRVGWLAGSDGLIERCTHLRHYTTLTPPVIDQDLATLAVQNRDKLLERTRGIVDKNYVRMIAWLENRKALFDWVEPQGGLVMLVRLKLPIDTELFIRGLAHDEHVFVVPCGSTFDMPGGYIRVGLGTDPDCLSEGLRRMGRYLDSGRWRLPVVSASGVRNHPGLDGGSS